MQLFTGGENVIEFLVTMFLVGWLLAFVLSFITFR